MEYAFTPVITLGVGDYQIQARGKFPTIWKSKFVTFRIHVGFISSIDPLARNTGGGEKWAK